MVGLAEHEIGDPVGPDDAFTAIAAKEGAAVVQAPESVHNHVSFQLPGDCGAPGSTGADPDASAVNPVQPASSTTTASDADAAAFAGPDSDNTLYEEEMQRHSIAIAGTLQAKRAQGVGGRPDAVAPVAVLDDRGRRQLWPQLLRPTQVSLWAAHHLSHSFLSAFPIP